MYQERNPGSHRLEEEYLGLSGWCKQFKHHLDKGEHFD